MMKAICVGAVLALVGLASRGIAQDLVDNINSGIAGLDPTT